MPKHEGIVQRLTGDNQAEVLISPRPQGIIGAPEVSEKVCHSATGGSCVRTTAVNEAGANEGDWVLVVHKSGALFRNGFTLLGMPVAGGLLGFLAGLMTGGAGLASAGVTICVTAGIILGVIVGGRMFKKSGSENLPVIAQVIQTREELARFLKSRGSKTKDDENAGDGCSLCTHCFK